MGTKARRKILGEENPENTIMQNATLPSKSNLFGRWCSSKTPQEGWYYLKLASLSHWASPRSVFWCLLVKIHSFHQTTTGENTRPHYIQTSLRPS